MDNNKVLKAAVFYAKNNVANIGLRPDGPLDADDKPPGKKPLPGKSWPAEATTDLNILEERYKLFPGRNIGIPTSIDNGFFVLDVDVDPVKKLNGEADLLELEAKFGPLPETLMQITPRGGRHLLFRHPKDREIKNGKLGGYTSLDIKGDGGYIVAYPSKVNGGGYEWVRGKPDFNRIAEPPDWLLENIGKNPSKLDRAMTHLKGKKFPPKISGDEWFELMRPISEGGRHERMLRIVGHLLGGVNPYVAYEMAHAWNRKNCKPPLSDDEMDRIINDLAERELKRRGVRHA